jgi:hypothetical protein
MIEDMDGADKHGSEGGEERKEKEQKKAWIMVGSVMIWLEYGVDSRLVLGQ